MALDYTFIKYQDVYTLSNVDLVSTLTYTITLKNCETSKIINTGIVKPGENTIITFVMDGIYSISVTDGIATEVIPDTLIYEKLLNRIISGTEKVLCGCGPCNDCDDCNECDDYLDLLAYITAYPIVLKPKYDSYVSIIQNELKCSFNETIICLMNQGFIRGKVEIKELFLKLIASSYLAFYFVELGTAIDSDEAEYIRTKFKSVKIFKCIKGLDINISDTTDLFTDGMQVYYWQLDSVEKDIISEIPLINQTYLNTKPVLNFSVFEQGNIVNYIEIGRIAFAIKETDILNFTIVDALNNDITDEFDYNYFPLTKTVLFVSKSPFSFSNIYFKFKSIINL